MLAFAFAAWKWLGGNWKWAVPLIALAVVGALWLWERGAHQACEARHAKLIADHALAIAAEQQRARNLSALIAAQQLEFERHAGQQQTRFVEVIRHVPVTNVCRDAPAVRALDGELRDLGFTGRPAAP
jgi:hypothetical protein